MTAEPKAPVKAPVKRSVLGRNAGESPREVTAEPGEGEVAAALLVALGRRPGSAEASWRRTRLAALGLLPRFPAG